MIRLALSLSIFLLFSSSVFAQRDRITAPVNNLESVMLTGHVPREALPQLDQGPVPASSPMPRMTLFLKPSNVQQAALQQLLADQQNPSSSNFHQWLTPEQYGDRFGVSQNDVAKITAWLQSQGFQVQEVARSRTFIYFTGTAQQTQAAFQTEIHRFVVDGKTHLANTSNPSVPAAFADLVREIHGLHDFRLKPRAKKAGSPPSSSTAPEYTIGGFHYVTPDDFATIYDVKPLYSAGIDGTGQSLVVVGQTDIDMSDIQTFRSRYQLPANDPQKILPRGETNPGISQNDLPEADLDLEWAGAVARNATVLYVYSSNVFNSITDAINNNYAPVITMSYGLCEPSDLVDLPTFQQMAQQANSQGITWLNAAGDAGAADCEGQNSGIAQTGLAVDVPGAIPEVTSMGGTEFMEQSGTYWSSSNNADGGSALSYIPERAWNDTRVDGSLSSGGGGASIYFPKPVWQTGPGVPGDGFRHVPDISLNSSDAHDATEVYTGGSLQPYGGTSVAAPSMAGIVTLLNQFLASGGAHQAGVGNINPMLYRMAQHTPSVFHDVSSGNNIVPCVVGSPNCTTGSLGYNAGPGYDEATGLGSPDANNFVHQWTSAVNAPTGSAIVPSISQNPVFERAPDSQGNRWPFTITLNEEAGVATTLTAFTINGQSQNIVSDFGSASIPAGGSIKTGTLGFQTLTVPTTVVFGFNGKDANGVTWSQQLAVPFDGPDAQLSVGGVSNAASGKVVAAPGMLVSVYGEAMGDFAQSAATIPLPDYLAGFEATVNNVPAPLYYVSPNQVNIQIPYETPTGSQVLSVGNPYANVNFTLNVTPAGPGIFMSNGYVSAPFSSAKRGQITTLFITGEGQVTPSLPTGTAPDPSTPLDQLPKPKLPYSMTVANEPAVIKFIGIPWALVGVTQINYEVPADAPLGDQPVVVTVGGVPSQAVKLTITQ